jgi:hypothetical protein
VAASIRSLRMLLLSGTIALVALAPSSTPSARDLPGSLNDKTFWQIVTGTSEAGGTFASNNWVSNEVPYQTVIPRLAARPVKGGVYIGVGPDQNFTYIVGLRPRIAFVVDIRRQNMLEHLMFKAVIELSSSRSEFLARLFSRPRAPGADAGQTAAALLASAAEQPIDEVRYAKYLREIIDHLEKTHGFTLSTDDERTIEYIYQTFVEYGPDITYAPQPIRLVPPGAMRSGSSPYPTFAELLTETDGQGVNRSYLANEENYKILREMQQKNLIVPVVGDFAGEKAVRSVGRWAREHGAKVTTFYTSNVEQYLFQNQVWREYYDNVATLPIDASSVFIRSYFPSQFRNRLMPGGQVMRQIPELPSSANAMRLPSGTLVCTIAELLAAVRAGKVNEYFDVIEMSR